MVNWGICQGMGGVSGDMPCAGMAKHQAGQAAFLGRWKTLIMARHLIMHSSTLRLRVESVT